MLEPDEAPPFAVEVELAKPSWLFDCAFVSPASLPFLSFAPEAEAVDSVSVVDEPTAAKVTAPPAVRLRAVVAVTRWFEIPRASAAPMPTLAPLAAPVALVVTDAVCVAVAEIAPVTVSAVPAPIVAEVVTFESQIATSR